LEIEAAGHTVNVQQFAGEIETGTPLALQGFKVHLGELDAAAGHEFVLVQAFAGHGEFRVRELVRQRLRLRPGERRPTGIAGDASRQDKLLPKPCGQRGKRHVHQEFGPGGDATFLEFGQNLLTGKIRQPVYRRAENDSSSACKARAPHADKPQHGRPAQAPVRDAAAAPARAAQVLAPLISRVASVATPASERSHGEAI
jgi:hypothetical protein